MSNVIQPPSLQQPTDRDPVCGMTVNSDSPYQANHDGQRLHFCSKHCLDKFNAEPRQYLPAPGQTGECAEHGDDGLALAAAELDRLAELVVHQPGEGFDLIDENRGEAAQQIRALGWVTLVPDLRRRGSRGRGIGHTRGRRLRCGLVAGLREPVLQLGV